MCGIGGFLIHKDQGRDASGCLNSMNLALQHRGPDDSGETFFDAGSNRLLGLTHRRLSIIDTSEAGHQPMIDKETGNCIIYNGELYNFKDLKKELGSLGAVFESETDTEVLLKAYSTWGIDFLSKLRGMFAFAIWDKQNEELIIARDHLGVKPLYFYNKNSTFLFSSEVRAILASKLVPRKLSYEGLLSYLSFGSVQEPYTMIEDICSLEPGSYLVCKKESISKQKYWSMKNYSQSLGKKSEPGVFDEIKSTLYESVNLQLVSDVPLGVFLSGGIDSAAIAGIASSGDTGTTSLSIIFENPELDERKYARLASNKFDTHHIEKKLTFDLFKNQLSKAINAYDQPSVDGLNTYFVSALAREAGLTVALSGVGGDELFAGYNGFKKSVTLSKMNRILTAFPHSLRSTVAYVLYKGSNSEKTRKFSSLLNADFQPELVSRVLFSNYQIQNFLSKSPKDFPEVWKQQCFGKIEESVESMDQINRSSFWELNTYMLSTLLRDTDQMSMAHNLEVRVPLLDHRLVELLLQTSGSLKTKKDVPKPLLVEPLQGLVPDECIYRPKQGFELPFSSWIKEEMKEEINRSFLSSDTKISKIFNSKKRSQLLNNYKDGNLSWSRIWSLFVLEKWLTTNKINIH